jgi:hypothetical protein
MTKNSKPITYAEASNTDKNLLRIYINSVLSAAATSLISDQSLQLKEISLDENIQKIANDLVAHEPDMTLDSLISESIAPLKRSITLESFEKVACYMGCVVSGGSNTECNRRCGTTFKEPQE